MRAKSTNAKPTSYGAEDLQARHNCREVLYCNFRVFDDETNRVAGYINDISIDGVRLMTEEPMSKGRVHRFRIELPKRSVGNGRFRTIRSIVFQAVTTWGTDDDRTSFYDCGFQFVNLDVATKALISELIFECHR